jgi:hypothetical protein
VLLIRERFKPFNIYQTFRELLAWMRLLPESRFKVTIGHNV